MPATYDLSSNVGKTRFWIPDTYIENPIFSDEEINFLLQSNNNRPLLAAASALIAIAGDPARLTSFSKGATSGTRTLAEDLHRKAAELKARDCKEQTGENTGDIIVGKIERSDFW